MTQDHIYALISKRTLHPDSYTLYLILNKAFNSVIHSTLFNILEKQGLPQSFVQIVKKLYHNPTEAPIVNGFTSRTHTQLRGVRKGCPLSPIRFALYINPYLCRLQAQGALDPTFSLHAFADDIAINTTSPKMLTSCLETINSMGPPMGLIPNFKKTELQAWGNASHLTLRLPTPKSGLSTSTDSSTPRTFYKYLGALVHIKEDPEQLATAVNSEIESWLQCLPSITFSPKEMTKLVNLHLIPKVTYRLIAHSLSPGDLLKIQTTIWKH